ncbi:Protease HtpX homolog [Propionispora sp. 2/2-37]|uniref:zinc metalloprotease HtpX n=1 Tax=Propionispora sp. 2/2-37 TaxID=1677858 RepID=UPI0006BB6379|nr:zinc metalloprotease HtpX [Propionispora sp. 2/2-37]CUH95573.1 Protease HtpX homolog [Propionispora sp. 2/2-37]
MNRLRTTVLLAGLTGLLLGIGSLLGGSKGMTVMFVLSMLANFVSYWFSDKIVLTMYGAQEASIKTNPDLIRIVSLLAQKAKIAMPKVYIIQTEVPNAFATGRNPRQAAVAVTAGLMRLVDREELEAVVAHELAHIKNRDTLISGMVASIAGVITMLAHLVRWTVFWRTGHGNDENNSIRGILEAVCLVILAPLAAGIIQLGVSRSREYLADETGAGISGKPLVLARALETIERYAAQKVMPEATPPTSHMFIVNPFISGTDSWIMNLFSTHPGTQERVKRLKAMAENMRC